MSQRDDFEGFAASKEYGTPHFRVEIPSSSKDPITIIEDFGFAEERSAEEKRAVLPRKIWSKIAQEVASDFNARIKARKLPVGKWSIGTVKVERLLGKELCVLAWAVEFIDPKEIDQAIARWKALRPEERWWLFIMTAAEGGRSENSSHRWRAALRSAIGGVIKEDSPKKPTHKKRMLLNPELPLLRHAGLTL